MIGQTILHYAPKAHPPLADKILEKLGEARLRSSNFGEQGGLVLRSNTIPSKGKL